MHAPEWRPHAFLSACTSNPATSVMHTVIRLSRGHLLPASRPAGHNLRMDSMPITTCHDQRIVCMTTGSIQPMPEFTLTDSRTTHARAGDTILSPLLARPATTYRIGGDLPWSRFFTDRRRYGTSSPPRWFPRQLRSRRLMSWATALERFSLIQPFAVTPNLPTTIDLSLPGHHRRQI